MISSAPDELAIMLHDIETALALGVDGVAIGCLTSAGRVNTERCERLMAVADRLYHIFQPELFHRKSFTVGRVRMAWNEPTNHQVRKNRNLLFPAYVSFARFPAMLRKTALALMFGFPLVLAAEEMSLSAPSAASADFSAGFKKLVTLGLPSLDGAIWASAGDESRDMDDYVLREMLTELKGAGWKLQTNGKPTFLTLGAAASKEVTASVGNQKGGGFLGALFGGGSKKAKSLDLVADANKLIATLDDAEKSKNFRERLEYSGTSSLGRLLIFATQLHQSGHPAEANRLANTVFTLGASPEAVIDAAVNILATHDLNVVTEAFFTLKDWAAYERDLRALTERYPRGWQAFPAVQMLLPAVAKRVAGGMSAKPAIEGVTLEPEAIAALDAALQDTKGAPDDDSVTRYAKENGISPASLTPDLRHQIAMMLSQGNEGNSGGPWLIEELPGEELKDPWSRLKRLGLDALPALAAVANDETLTFSRNASSDRSSYGSSRQSAADQALDAYQSMDRPLTRGELACRLLASTLPGEDQEESGPQALADRAMEFWKAHQKKSKLDLLLVFLTEGDSSQKQTAGTALAEMPDEAARQSFEKYVLESDDITNTLSLVTPYLKLRKIAAKEFFTRYSAALKTQLEGVDLDRISGGYEIKQAGGVDKYLKKLSLFVSGESPRKLVLALAKAEKPNVRQINSLAATVAESSPDQFVPLYLEAAVMATHVETRSAFLSAIAPRGYGRNRPDNEEEKKEPSIPSTQIPHWKTLLEDERSSADGIKISGATASALEQLYSPGTLEQISELYQLDLLAAAQLILTRAKDRIASKSPTPLPDSDKVSAARLDEILKLLAAANPEAVHDLAKSWPLDEQLAFQKWRGNPEHAEKIPVSVMAASMLLVAPIDNIVGPSVAQQTEILKSLNLKPGAKVDRDLIINLADTLALDAKKHSGLVVFFSRNPLTMGVNFQALQLSDPSGKSNGYLRYGLRQVASGFGDTNIDAAVGVDWYFERSSKQALWKIDDKTVTSPEPEALDSLREILAMDTKPLQLMISVLHRDDLEKVTKLNQPEEEDSESPEE